ncbi:hypothetical protein E2C01_087511 [Portunus trituberculatus]|uniref:Uncharacterized protein n=1 Tax=Portunus trituberculatus TaxID=210409 RepID=A0A5B7J8A4_PORTR|nr:hypothetical protein [Portunus trituberculatus]
MRGSKFHIGPESLLRPVDGQGHACVCGAFCGLHQIF